MTAWCGRASRSPTRRASLSAILGDRRYVHFVAMLEGLDGGYDFNLDALFELGLQALLDRFARLIERAQDRP